MALRTNVVVCGALFAALLVIAIIGGSLSDRYAGNLFGTMTYY